MADGKSKAILCNLMKCLENTVHAHSESTPQESVTTPKEKTDEKPKVELTAPQVTLDDVEESGLEGKGSTTVECSSRDNKEAEHQVKDSSVAQGAEAAGAGPDSNLTREMLAALQQMREDDLRGLDDVNELEYDDDDVLYDYYSYH